MIENYRGIAFSMAVVAILALPALAVAQSPTGRSTTAPAGPATSSTHTPSTTTPATGAATSTGQYTTEAEAKSHCSGDTVVWANLSSKIYHFSGSKDYGTTKRGAYMCEKATAAAGIRAAKNEKHP